MESTMEAVMSTAVPEVHSEATSLSQNEFVLVEEQHFVPALLQES